MDENTRIPGIPGIPRHQRSFAEIVQQILAEGCGRTEEQRQVRMAWRPDDLAKRIGCDRTTISKWLGGTVGKPREFLVKQLVKVAFGHEQSNTPLAAELYAAYRQIEINKSDKSNQSKEKKSLELDDSPLDAHTHPLAQGEFYIPRPDQTGHDPNTIPIFLRLVFLGLAKITTNSGTIVFAISSARLNVGADGGCIADLNKDYEKGWIEEDTIVRAVPANFGEIAYHVSTKDPTIPLSGNVLMHHGDNTHVRLFDVSIDQANNTVRIYGSVTFDIDGIRVDVKRSRLRAQPPEQQSKIERMQARLAACVLKECGEGVVDIPEAKR